MKKACFIILTCLVFVANLNSQDDKISDEISNFVYKNNLILVDFEYVKKAVGDGTYSSKKPIIIDARTENRYNYNTIPTSINIPSPSFYKYYYKLKDTPKDKEIIIFCDGMDCPKSVKVAKMLSDRGFKNLKIYQYGMPDWRKKSYYQVNNLQMKKLITSPNEFTVIDIRSKKRYEKSHIPNSISVPYKDIASLKGKIPFAKSTHILIISNDAKKDPKPYEYAQALIDEGYTNVGIYVKGYRAWKMLVAKSKSNLKNKSKKDIDPFLGPIKKGADEGTVDAKWFIKHYKKMPRKTTIVDVRENSERKAGFISSSKNISLEENTEEEFISRLPKDRYIIFYCARGNRAYDAYNLIKSKNIPLSEKVLYLDAVITCKKWKCKIIPNEPTDPTIW